MQCSNCGQQNDPAAQHCAGCGGILSAGAPAMGYSGPESNLGPAPHHLVQSILVTLFCCQPFGIVAIVFSALTMGANSSGDYEKAHLNSGRASTWGWISCGVGVVAIIGWIILVAIGGSMAP